MGLTEKSPVKLGTERLYLKPVEELDLPILHEILTDHSVRKYLFDEQIISLTETGEILNKIVTTFREEGYGLWLLYEKYSQEIVGLAGLYHFFSEAQPQLLYALLPQYQTRGFATEASRRVITYAFEELGYTYLLASCNVPNKASIAVMKRLGMQWMKNESIDGQELVFYKLNRELTTHINTA